MKLVPKAVMIQALAVKVRAKRTRVVSWESFHLSYSKTFKKRKTLPRVLVITCKKIRRTGRMMRFVRQDRIAQAVERWA